MRIWHATSGERQQGHERSYIGGMPMLPLGGTLPIFERTSTEMTFFFQIELPPDHPWAGHLVSVFAVTDFVDDDTFIPKLPSPLAGAMLDRAFFDGYQTFFRLIVFPADQAVTAAGYTEKIAFRQLQFADDVPEDPIAFGRLDEAPVWMLDDESPESFEGRTDLCRFLFQTQENYEFATVAGAPRQKRPDYSSPDAGGSVDCVAPEYDLFASNALFFFGIDADERRVYVVPQS